MIARDRIDPPDRSRLDAETNALLELAVTPAGHTAETIAVLAHNPELVGPFLGWAAALHMNGLLSPRHHEILALRTAHNCGSAFEWQEHLGWARQAGMGDEDIEAVVGRSLSEPVEDALVAAADELHSGQDMTDPTRQTLLEALGSGSVVEVSMVVGQYTMLSMLANVTGCDEVSPP